MSDFEFIYTKDPPTHISVSQMRKFQKCQVQWYFDKLTDVPRTFGDRMLVGNVVHAGLEQANLLAMNGTDTNDQIIQQAAATEFQQLTGENDYDWSIWKSPEKVWHQSLRILEKAVPETRDVLAMPLYVEHSIGDESAGGTKIEFDSGHILVGYVDVVDVYGSIGDYKVGKAAKTQADVDQDLQLSLYAFAIHGIPTEPVKVVLMSVDSGEKTLGNSGKCKPVEGMREGWQCEQAYEIANKVSLSLAFAVANHVFAPTTGGWHCGPKYCEFWQQCPYGGKH